MSASAWPPTAGEWGALLLASTIPVRELARAQVPDRAGHVPLAARGPGRLRRHGHEPARSRMEQAPASASPDRRYDGTCASCCSGSRPTSPVGPPARRSRPSKRLRSATGCWHASSLGSRARLCSKLTSDVCVPSSCRHSTGFSRRPGRDFRHGLHPMACERRLGAARSDDRDSGHGNYRSYGAHKDDAAITTIPG